MKKKEEMKTMMKMIQCMENLNKEIKNMKELNKNLELKNTMIWNEKFVDLRWQKKEISDLEESMEIIQPEERKTMNYQSSKDQINTTYVNTHVRTILEGEESKKRTDKYIWKNNCQNILEFVEKY